MAALISPALGDTHKKRKWSGGKGALSRDGHLFSPHFRLLLLFIQQQLKHY